MIRSFYAAAFCVVGLCSHAAGQMTSTLALDGTSFVSFGNEQIFPIPLGSSVVFEFGTASPDGSVPFTIQPSGVTIPAIPMGTAGSELHYTLFSSTSGLMSQTSSGRRIDFTAPLRATVVSPNAVSGHYDYSIPITTETTEAVDIAGALEIEITGLRLIEGVWYCQLVGGTTNKANAFPEPGTAVYAVLNGTFDQVPELQP